jgi:vacuolar iron transporter family protein
LFEAYSIAKFFNKESIRMGISRRLDKARAAFRNKDLDMASQAHQLPGILWEPAEEHSGESSQYLGDFVYGGLDGIITTFAVVSGVAGADLGANVILIMGLANLFADGFSMATGAYLSLKSEKEYFQREFNREMWEVEHFREAEQAELFEIYTHRGYSEAEARQLVNIHGQNPDRLVNAMMVDELGLLKDEKKPIFSGLSTLAAFILAGVLPLLIYLVGIFIPISGSVSFGVSIALSALALFGLGAAKVMVTQLNPIRSGLEMLLVGGLAASVAYGVGWLLKGLGL